MRNGWKLVILAGIVAGCGSYAVQEGDGASSLTPTPTSSASGTPTATPVLPFAAPPAYPSTAFDTVIQPFLANATILSGAGGAAGKGCGGSASCHAPPLGQSGVIMNTGLTPVTAIDESDNALNLACSSNLNTFQPPNGILLTYFCASSNAGATTSTHIPDRVPVALVTPAVCQALYAWVSSGGATMLGTAATAQMPLCPIGLQ